MKKFLKILAYVVLSLIVLAGAGFAYLSVRKPDIASPSTVKIEPTPERLARGKYIAAVADCEGCHSQSDSTRFAFPKLDDGHYAGFEFTKDMGMPGLVV